MDNVSITLSRNEVGQVLDGINVLIEQWEATAAYLARGVIDDEVCIREASDAHEATAIAEIYREIAGQIEKQLVAGT